MKYFLTKNGVTIDENRNIIPMDESNAIYQKYLDFLKADGTVEQTDLLSDFEIDLVRTEAIDKLKKECYYELALTDWYFVRKIDIGIEVPKKIIDQRNKIRKKYNDLINENLS